MSFVFKLLKFTTLIVALVAPICTCFSQLVVTDGYTATQLATALTGSNVTISNASLTGIPVQSGQFTYTGSDFPLSSGVLLSTGSVFDAVGPNSGSDITTITGGAGNSLLTSISGNDTFDAIMLEFDFQAKSDNISFSYILASEEYNEYVSSFSDDFGCFLSGPGIAGEENIALIPLTVTPVSITNVNLTNYPEYFIDNEFGTTNIEFDGYTTVMTAQKTGLVPCETYTIKIIIADANDASFDSGIFLQANSLSQQNLSVQTNTATVNGNGTALEGCSPTGFTFNLDAIHSVNAVIPFQFTGSAIDGIDYQYVSSPIIIAAGQTSGTILINTIADYLNEGTESIVMIYQNSTCGSYDTVTLFISDHVPLELVTTVIHPSCMEETNGQIVFNISGGTSPYNYTLTDTLLNVTTIYDTNPVYGLSAATYHVEVTDTFGCTANDIVKLQLDFTNINLAFSPNNDGVNDYCHIPCAENFNNTVRIYNRWGDEIAFFANYNNDDIKWLGTNNSGTSVKADTYFYIIESYGVTVDAVDATASGWIQVVR